MENFKFIEELIQTKDYLELTQDERAVVDTALGEGRYMELRQGILAMRGEKLPVKNRRATELLEAWKSERSGLAGLLLKPLPAYSYLIILCIFGLIYWLIPAKVVTQTLIAEKEVPVVVRDTVTVLKVDTLWRERVVRVPDPKVVQSEQAETIVPVQSVIERKSLSEQEDLLDLVVRGD